MFVMMMFVREEPVHRIHEWIMEWISKGIMAGKEGSEEVEWIRGMEVGVSVKVILRVASATTGSVSAEE